MPVDPLIFVVALAVTAFAAAVQGIVGVGFAMVAVPVLSLLDPVLTPVPQLLVTLPLTVLMAWRERHAMDLAGVGWVLAGRLPGALVGLWLIKLATDRTLDVLIAAITLAAVAIIGFGFTIRRMPVTEFLAGLFSGVASLVASIGGPPVALIYREERGETIRASLAAVFTIGIGITLATRIAAGEITGTDVRLGAMLFPALLAGYALSGRLRYRFEGRPIRIGILVLSGLAASGLLVRAWLG